MGKYHKGIRIEGADEFLLAVNITGHGAPTEDTEAEPGMCYLDEDSEHGDLYKCIGVLVTETRTVYRWKKLAGQEEVDQLSEAIADRATLGNGVITFWKGDTELFTVDISSVGGSGGGVSFVLGETLELDNGVLNVKTTNAAERDNTLPITSSGVYTIVGNIGAVLDTI